MTPHTFILKAHIKSFMSRVGINPVAVADNRISPVIQELHMPAPHEFLGFYAFSFLLRQFLDFRGINLQFRLGIDLPYVVVKRKGH